MKKREEILLKHLRTNSREKLNTISKKTGIPISTLFDMLKALKKEVIKKATVILNFSELGFITRAQVFLKVPFQEKEELKKHLICHESVNSIYKINNGWCFIAETIHKNVLELDAFVEKLEERFTIEDKEIHYIIDEVKKEGFYNVAQT